MNTAWARRVLFRVTAIPIAGAMLALPPLYLTSSSVKEHRTGQEFELSRAGPARIPGATSDAYSVGSAVRCMMGWCSLAIARAYAFSLYVDEDSLVFLHQQLQPEGTPAATAATPPLPAASPLQTLLHRKLEGSAPGEISIVLMMARDIPGEHIAHGFRNSISQRFKGPPTPLSINATAPSSSDALLSGKRAMMASAGSVSSSTNSVSIAQPVRASGGDRQQQLAMLCAAFSHSSFKTGDEVSFTWRRDGSLAVAIQGSLVPSATLTDPYVIWALFDVYCGPRAVSSSAVKAFESNIGAALAGAVVVAPSEPSSAPPDDGSFIDRFAALALEAKQAVTQFAARMRSADGDSDAAVQRRGPHVDTRRLQEIVEHEHTTSGKLR